MPDMDMCRFAAVRLPLFHVNGSFYPMNSTNTVPGVYTATDNLANRTLASPQKGAFIHQGLPRLVSTALLALLAASAAELTWQLAEPPARQTQTGAVMPSVLPAMAGASPVDLERLARANLFGHKAAPVKQPIKTAPVIRAQQVQTRLAVKLVGVLWSADSSHSQAFLVHDGQQRVYALGDALDMPQRVIITAIEADRVVLDVSGRSEYVLLDQAAVTKNGRSVSRAQVVGSHAGVAHQPPAQVDFNAPNLRQIVGNYKQTLLQNPLSFGRYIQLRPYSQNGQTAGYQLQPGRDQRLFRSLGLRAGDVVTHVNGMDLTSSANIAELMNLLRQGGEARIGLLREGVIHDVKILL